MLDTRKCEVGTAEELDIQIRDIFALALLGEGHQICGTLYIDYSNESVRQASLLPALRGRGVEIVWRKKPERA